MVFFGFFFFNKIHFCHLNERIRNKDGKTNNVTPGEWDGRFSSQPTGFPVYPMHSAEGTHSLTGGC